MTFAGSKFYYLLQYTDYSAHGIPGPDRFRKYGFEYHRDLGGSRSLYRGKSEEKALVIYVSVPTFDSGDREWDSYRKLFLIPKRNGIAGYMVSGGYNIAKVTAYKGLYCADAEIKSLLKRVANEA